jgi:hypothetical protein
MRQICFAAEEPLFDKIEGIRFARRQKTMTSTLKLLLEEGIKVIEQEPPMPTGRCEV